ncbi:MAG TPA: hypothetical protein PLP66_12590, partial [Phycisphaerae bacterium]|nr:hypothetical protein [Phycisphaerae bacterium]
YVPGANPDYDVAVQSRAAVSAYLTQAQAEHCTFAEASDGLCQLGALLEKTRQAAVSRKAAAKPAEVQPR